jgi:putative transposase
MSQSLAQIYVHVVFSTKSRQPSLCDPYLRNETHRFLGGLCNRLDCPVLRVGGVADHVHLLCRLGRSVAVADFVKELKRESSKWLKSRDASLAEFQWQTGYGVFSVSPAHVEALLTYIGDQENHHKIVIAFMTRGALRDPGL